MPQQDPFAIPGMDTPGIGGYASQAQQPQGLPKVAADDYGYLPPGYEMQIPLTHSQRTQGVLAALAQFAGTLGGDQQVVETAQALWKQNEQQRQVAHQTNLLAQIGRAKLEEERKIALAKAQMDMVQAGDDYAQHSQLDPRQFMESAGALGTDQFPQEFGQAFPQGPIDRSQMAGSIEEQQGLGKNRAAEATQADALERKRQEVVMAAEEQLKADEARKQFDLQQAGDKSGAEAAGRVNALSTPEMLPKQKALTAAQTQQPQPVAGALNPVVDRIEEEMRRLDKAKPETAPGAAPDETGDFKTRVDAIKRELTTAKPGSLTLEDLRRIIMLVDPGPADWMNSPTSEGGAEWQQKKTILLKELDALIKKHAGSVVE